jgi:N-carbamoylputrescine amidase
MSQVRVAVGEMPPNLEAGTDEWKALIYQLAATEADIFVLNELPFGSWIACHPEFDEDTAKRSIESHDRAMDELGSLGVPDILGSRLTVIDGVRRNSGFHFRRGEGYRDFYTKRHVPLSPGYYERAWYDPGPAEFPLIEVAGIKVGMLLCTDIMFNEHARHYGRQSGQLIVVPRCSPPIARDFFDTALAMASVASGCYVASSNRAGKDELGDAFEGRGAIYNPWGQHIAQTSPIQPLTYADLNLDFVQQKQSIYPCDVPE